MRKIIFLLILVLGSLSASAQMNYIAKGNKLIYFGIAVGASYGDYKVIRSPKLNAAEDTIVRVETQGGAGFDLGIISNFQVHKYFDIRFVPALSFSDKSVLFTDKFGAQTKKTVQSIYFNLPITFRYKSKPINDFRFFVLAGFRYNFDLNANSNERNVETQLLVNRHDFGVEMGFGFQIFMPTFILSPEIKVYHSMKDMKKDNPALIHSRAIEKMFSRIFTLTINLEG
ncbi:MAG: outer membrane beta-barrel protein [Chitinophagales bacterium]